VRPQYPNNTCVPVIASILTMGCRLLSSSCRYGIFRRALDMGVMGAFAMAKEVSPHMIERGHGTLLYTGATAAYRGNQ
jgi:NAD(P)-dependent dehydrogenase (short-subunit alcohol dehydrogenase family)